MGSGVDGGVYRDPGALQALEGAGTVSVAHALVSPCGSFTAAKSGKKGEKGGGRTVVAALLLLAPHPGLLELLRDWVQQVLHPRRPCDGTSCVSCQDS